MDKIEVALGKRSYDILIGEKCLNIIGEKLKKISCSKKVILINDENVAKLYSITVKESLKKSGFKVYNIILPPGEERKSFISLVKLCNQILKYNIDRDTTIIALGGGVIGDLSGFVASILLRGINFVQIPTTLLAQVDSSIGGKTAINTNYGKNLVGSFYQPRLVLIDNSTLLSLSEREFLCGYAEIVKYALINDPVFFEFLEKNKAKIKKRDSKILQEIIKRSCLSKAAIVAEDETEKNGKRALLNLGHTFGHSLEKETKYADYLKHGEAVAIGMVLAFKLSNQLGFCEIEDVNRIVKHFKYFKIPTSCKEIIYDWNIDNIYENLFQDKKIENGNLVLILANGIGKSFIARNLDNNFILNFLKESI